MNVVRSKYGSVVVVDGIFYTPTYREVFCPLTPEEHLAFLNSVEGAEEAIGDRLQYHILIRIANALTTVTN